MCFSEQVAAKHVIYGAHPNVMGLFTALWDSVPVEQVGASLGTLGQLGNTCCYLSTGSVDPRLLGAHVMPCMVLSWLSPGSRANCCVCSDLTKYAPNRSDQLPTRIRASDERFWSFLTLSFSVCASLHRKEASQRDN